MQRSIGALAPLSAESDPQRGRAATVWTRWWPKSPPGSRPARRPAPRVSSAPPCLPALADLGRGGKIPPPFLSTMAPSVPARLGRADQQLGCMGHWPAALNASSDLISLHYDCAPDPDDMESAVADRILLEGVLGTAWVRAHVLAVVGTFGARSPAYRGAPCERVVRAVWDDVLDVPVQVAGAQPGQLHAWRTRRARLGAVRGVFPTWSAALAKGGHVYVKEGGPSDFTALVLARVAAAQQRTSAPAGPCVHVVQHSAWNEAHADPRALAVVRNCTLCDYRGPKATGRGPLADGNLALQRPAMDPRCPACLPHPGALLVPPGFAEQAHVSRLGCAWDIAFEEFARADSWCAGPVRRAGPGTCIDFSDSAELAHILRLPHLTAESFAEEWLGRERDLSGAPLPRIACRGRSDTWSTMATLALAGCAIASLGRMVRRRGTSARAARHTDSLGAGPPAAGSSRASQLSRAGEGQSLIAC